MTQGGMMSKVPDEYEIIRQRSYMLPVRPTPLHRARHGNKKTYDDQKDLKFHWGLLLKKEHNQEPLFSGTLHLNVIFLFKYPKSWPKYKKTEVPHTNKPDLSNLIKLIEDIGTGIIYTDDSIIYSISAKKHYSDEDKILFTISQIEKEQ